MLAAASVYDDPLVKAVLAIHILAAVVWVGGGIVLGLFGVIERTQEDQTLTVVYLRRAGRVRTRCFLPTSFVLLACGLGLVGLLHVSFSEPWIDLALGGWFVCLALSTAYLVPATEDLVHRAASGISNSELGAVVRRLRLAASFESLVLVLVVIDMVARP